MTGICPVQVIADSVSNRSKGYGFVRFGSEQERDMALGQMNGIHINNRPIRVSLATAKKNPGQITATPVAQPPHPSDFDPTNTTLFIGGLSGGVTEEQLRSVFAAYGDIVYVKVPPGKGCGFVQFVQRAAAESAMGHMQGQLLGSSSIRISWGRSNSSRSQAAAATTHTPSYAYSAYTAPAAATAASYAGYDTNLLAQYGYAAPSVDPYAAYYASIQQADPYQVCWASFSAAFLLHPMFPYVISYLCCVESLLVCICAHEVVQLAQPAWLVRVILSNLYWSAPSFAVVIGLRWQQLCSDCLNRGKMQSLYFCVVSSNFGADSRPIWGLHNIMCKQ